MMTECVSNEGVNLSFCFSNGLFRPLLISIFDRWGKHPLMHRVMIARENSTTRHRMIDHLGSQISQGTMRPFFVIKFHKVLQYPLIFL